MQHYQKGLQVLAVYEYQNSIESAGVVKRMYKYRHSLPANEAVKEIESGQMFES